MTIKVMARITTKTLQRFEFEVPPVEFILEDVAKQLEAESGRMPQALKDIDTLPPERVGREWIMFRLHSKHEGFIELPGRTIDVETKSVDTVEVWTVQQVAELPAGIEAGDPDEPKPFLGVSELLGTGLSVYGLWVEKDGTRFLLPYEINLQPALDVVSAHNIEKVMQKMDCYTPGDVIVMPPPVAFPNEMEAALFLQDYVSEVDNPVGGERTARAVTREAWVD